MATSSFSFSTVVPSSSIPSFSNITLPNYSFPFQLEPYNYIIWRFQISPAIVGCNLKNFVDGSLPILPLTTVTNVTNNGETVQTVVSTQYVSSEIGLIKLLLDGFSHPSL